MSLDRFSWLAGLGISLGLGMSYGAAPPNAEDPEAILQRISDKVAEHLSLLPNYTCHEAINRLVRPPYASDFMQRDRIELEVAFVGQQELFAHPGDREFQEQKITNLVRTGAIGNGLFGSHAEAIFLGGVASFEYSGVFNKDGHKAFRYNFQVPLEKSNFTVSHNHLEAIVAYQGSVWADYDTLDLLRLEITSNQIPVHIGLSYLKEAADYTPLRIGNSEFLLPLHSEMEVWDGAGNRSLNEVTLEQCREFKGESTVTFGQPVNGPLPARSPSEQ
jgi:hypothetical protein